MTLELTDEELEILQDFAACWCNEDGDTWDKPTNSYPNQDKSRLYTTDRVSNLLRKLNMPDYSKLFIP